MNIVDWILFVLFALCVCYLLLYAIASKFYRVPEFPEARIYCLNRAVPCVSSKNT